MPLMARGYALLLLLENALDVDLPLLDELELHRKALDLLRTPSKRFSASCRAHSRNSKGRATRR